MKTEHDKEQRYYAMPQLHRWFAVSSVVLLLSVFALILADHYRPWRAHQRDFREREVTLSLARIEALDAAIERKLTAEIAVAPDATPDDSPAPVGTLEEAPATDPFADAVEETPAADPFADAVEEAPAADPFADAVEEAPAADPFADAVEDAPAADPFADAVEESPAADPFADAVEETPAADPFADAVEEAPTADPFADAVEEAPAESSDIQEEAIEEAPSLEELLDERTLEDLQQERMLLERKLAQISPEHMSFANRFIGYFRDLPILDLSSPTYKVEQLIIHDSTEDLHFTEVPRIDRCMTCHKGIDRALFAEEAQPLTAHPKLDLFVSPTSPHPKESFGCTTCHQGRGRGTEFHSTAHTPIDHEQETAWVQDHHWKEDHHWEAPMLEARYSEASCLTCHRTESRIPGADKLNWSLTLIEQAGCYSCHTMERIPDRAKHGPSLQFLAAKSTPDWVRSWIQDPKAIREDTWMPHSFAAAADKEPQRIAAEVSAITEALFAASQALEQQNNIPTGNAAKGREQFDALGCAACHLAPEEAPLTKRIPDALRRMHGPHLTGLAAKTNATWLFNWLKDPERYNPDTAMPDLRLSDEEAADLTAYLLAPEAAVPEVAPVADDNIYRNILREHRIRRESPEALDAELAAMDSATLRSTLGMQLITHYCCAGCHQIPGAEDNALIGPELSAFGDKSLHELDFGKQHFAHRKATWLDHKLQDSRIYDEGVEKEAVDHLRMPQYDFSEAEREALITALLGMRALPEGLKLERHLDDAETAIEAGRVLLRQMNCTGCHVMEDEGGNLAPILTQYLKKIKGYADSEAKAMAATFGPPNLRGEGKKVQSAWLFDFLHSPEVIRPWVSVRMPTYAMSDDQCNAFLHYFAALDDEPFPFVQANTSDPTSELYQAGKLLFAKEYLDCANCHIQGDKFPEGDPDRWAPDFGLSEKRLKPTWVLEWMYDPQALEPGTKMPTYFDPEYFDDAGPEDILEGDEHQQIQAITDYIMGIAYDMPSNMHATNTSNFTDGGDAPSVPSPDAVLTHIEFQEE